MSIDEHTIWLQGNYKYKLCITYKRIVDGFQADAFCEEGYFYAFVLRNDTMPRSGHKLLCALHDWVIHLIQDLKHE